MALVISIQVFNISLNQNDALIGKTGHVFNFVNEIESFAEFVAEVCLTDQDIFPESQVPGGTLGFEEEETHFFERNYNFAYSEVTYFIRKRSSNTYLRIDFKEHIQEITTPPPQV